jgi:hypothetical protein
LDHGPGRGDADAERGRDRDHPEPTPPTLRLILDPGPFFRGNRRPNLISSRDGASDEPIRFRLELPKLTHPAWH